MWGRELFWMAFIAAYLAFPQGPWPYWHPRIPVEGTFIQDWLTRAGTEGEDPEFKDVSILRKDIWEQFRQAVSLYHPCGL